MRNLLLVALLFSLFLVIGPVKAVSYAYVNSFSGTYVAWTESGASPYLDAIGGGYIATSTANAKEGTFDFPATSGVTALELYAKISNALGDDYVVVQTELGEESIFPSTTSYQWYSVSKSDNTGFSVTYANGLNTPHRTITIDAARLVYSMGGTTYTYSISLTTATSLTMNALKDLHYSFPLTSATSIDFSAIKAYVHSFILTSQTLINFTKTQTLHYNFPLNGGLSITMHIPVPGGLAAKAVHLWMILGFMAVLVLLPLIVVLWKRHL